jgi:hypothetical protein
VRFFNDYAHLECLICGKRNMFLIQRGPKYIKYCSNACRQKAYRQRKIKG